MVKTKFLLIIFYIIATCLVLLFVFGDAGVLENMTQSQEIKRLNTLVQESQKDINNMTEEYNSLLSMKTPNQAFLIDQGRKSKDIVIFKVSDSTDSDTNQKSISEQKLFLTISLVALCILVVGCICIAIIHFNDKKNKQKENANV